MCICECTFAQTCMPFGRRAYIMQCTHVCIHAHTCAYMHTRIRTCTWIQAHKTRMHVCAQICMHVYMCVCTHVHTRVCTKYMNAYVCTHASGYTCVVNACSHVYMSIRVYTSSTQLTHPTPTDACLILHNAVCICNPFHRCGVLIGISTTVDGFDP